MPPTRPFSETTLLIYDEVLKQVTNPPHYFYPRDLVDELGISRQTIANILTRLVGLGLLERRAARYTCSKDMVGQLVEYIIQCREKKEAPGSRLSSTPGKLVFSDDDTVAIHRFTNAILTAQSQKIEHYVTAKQAWIDELEQGIAALKKELKYARSRSHPQGKPVKEEFVAEIIDRLLSNG